MICLDGGFGEGGGQLVRTALGLSTLTGASFEIMNIRRGRCDSGIKAQHLKCVEVLENLSGAKAEGAVIGSERLAFFPGKMESRTLSVDVGTAGSITLVLQAALVPLIFGTGKVRLKLFGGTDVPWSEPFDYFREVLMPNLAPFCSRFDVSLERRGYYPKGGGMAEVVVIPEHRVCDFSSFGDFKACLSGKRIDLVERGSLAVIKGVSHASLDLQKSSVAERQALAAKRGLSDLGCPVIIQSSYSDSLSTGSGICLWAEFTNLRGEIDQKNPCILGSDSLGARGKRAEDVGREAAESLVSEISSGAPVDKYKADQLLPFLALFGGRIRVSQVTPHCLANIYVIEQFLGKCFRVEGNVISA
ncbi:RNA 3'-terminal phosphate cyclase [Candidatus Woesearchaeota archaeon]|nr:RNA 3'-terminal phosphate cyclase [Candidatus Woesearchaeota archaeon]